MKAIAISGSSRMNGNTKMLMDRCLGVLEKEGIEITLVQMAEKRVEPCAACGGCFRTRDKQCAIKDDDFHEIFAQMLEADIIVVGSPVYFGSATPQLMSLLDRAGYVGRANESPFSRKIGGPIVVARRAGQNFTYAQLLFWYMINDMVVPGSTYWNIGFGRAIGDIQADEEAILTVERFGQAVNSLLLVTAEGEHARDIVQHLGSGPADQLGTGRRGSCVLEFT